MYLKDRNSMKKFKIDSLNYKEPNKRLSTQELLQIIYEKMKEGYTSFEITASGQHNIGGPLWSDDGTELEFNVVNPGQRVGSMGMPNTKITIDGSAPADVGWLNSGAEIILKGDGGDTTAHCAASGKIYVAGRVGTRSGALMKHDPKYPAPEFWVLKNTGSFSFEFMGGGTAVVCGVDCENMGSVIGSRSCVGMVGGTIYVRGNVNNLSEDVYLLDIDENDIAFLKNGLKVFLNKIEREDLIDRLCDFSQWKKIVAKTFEERKANHLIPMKDFRLNRWFKENDGGIFSDVYEDDFKVYSIVNKGDHRLRYPSWDNYTQSAPCENHCPIGIPTQKRINLIKNDKLKEAIELVLEYSPFPACVCGNLCPNLCMEECNRGYVDEPIKFDALGMMSRDVPAPSMPVTKEETVAVIGAGVAGLSAAWLLRKKGYKVTVYEQDSDIGGKLRQVIPYERLSKECLDAEINRIKNCGIDFKLSTKLTKELFEEIRSKYNAVIIACGAHNPVVIPFEGHEKLVKGLDFLKAVKDGERVNIGKKVVVIGAGNAAMDVILEAYNSGAEDVTAIDIQKPAAFDKEINHCKSLGAKILYPCFTEKVTDEGVVLRDGTLLKADTVIISIGDRPMFDFLDSNMLDERGMLKLNQYKQTVLDNVFAAGDAIKQGLFTNAIADGNNAAKNVINLLTGKELDTFDKMPILPRDKVKTEYYQGVSALKVQEIEPWEEKDRCMSCGLCRDCEFCLQACPEQAISKYTNEKGETIYVSNEERCIGCGICAGVCPCGVWTMKDNFENIDDLASI